MQASPSSQVDRRVDAARRRVAGVGRAGVAVVARDRAVDAAEAGSQPSGAGVAVVAGDGVFTQPVAALHESAVQASKSLLAAATRASRSPTPTRRARRYTGTAASETASAFAAWMTWYAVATSPSSQAGAVRIGCRSAGKVDSVPRTSGRPPVEIERPSSSRVHVLVREVHGRLPRERGRAADDGADADDQHQHTPAGHAGQRERSPRTRSRESNRTLHTAPIGGSRPRV